MNNIQNKLLALLIVLMTVPMTGWAQEVQSHAHNYVNSVCTKCGFQRKLASSNVGAVGILDGREAIVVELNINGVTKKVAVATMNVGATSVDEGAGRDIVAPCHGKMFTFADANNASKTGLSDGWYVPSKDELEALMNKCSWNGTKKGLEWISEDHGTSFFLPVCGFTNPNATTPIYRSVHADYWTSTESDASKGWNLFFNANGKQVRAFDKTYKFNVRPFHELGEISGIQLTPTATNVQGYTNEKYTNAFDGITTNKWCGYIADPYYDNLYVEFKASAPTTVGAYYLYTGSDTQNGVRNPKEWGLYAKVNQSDSWTEISRISDGELPTTASTKKEFVIDSEFRDYSYQYFRLDVYTLTRGQTFEIGEIGLEAEHFHTFKAGKFNCEVCGYVKPHDHNYVNSVCTKCDGLRKFTSTNAGDVGMLEGREAIVVELNSGAVTKKVAVATENLIGKNVYGQDDSWFDYWRANTPANNCLTGLWYVPSKEELLALSTQLTWNSTKKGGELNFPAKGTSLFFPALGWRDLDGSHDNGNAACLWSSTEGSKSGIGWSMKIDNRNGHVIEIEKDKSYNVRPFYEVEISGNANSYARWKLNFLTNTLTFEGTGSTGHISSFTNTKEWEDYKSYINAVVIGEGITEIGADCFMGMDIESVSLPSTLQTINKNAFKNCVNLKEVTLPASLQNINENAFAGCTNLKTLIYAEGTTEVKRAYATNVTTVVIPNSVTKIGNRAFSDCSKIKNLSLPSSVTTIGNFAMYGCANLMQLNFPASLQSIGYSAFQRCVELREVTWPNTVTIMTANAFADCTNLQRVNLPNSLVEIGVRAFSNCANLASIELPASLQTIGNSAFYDCKKLQNIIIPGNVTQIDETTFSGCVALQSITIPSAVNSVGTKAFYDTRSLTHVTIEGSPNIAKDAFYNCTALEVVELKAEQAFDSNSAAFTNCSTANCVLRVSSAIYDWARVTAPWSGFSTIELSSNVMLVAADDTKNAVYLTPNAADNVLEIVDGLKTVKVYDDINMQSLTYKRNFSSATWQSLFVPFDIEVTEDVLSLCDIAFPYMVSTKGSTNGGTQEGEKGLDALVLMKLESGETAHGGTPYFIRPKNEGAFELVVENTILRNTDEKQTVECATVFDEYQFIGQYTQGKPAAGTTWYAITPSGSLAMGADDSPALGAMRCYMTKTSKNLGAAPAQAKAMRILTWGEDDEATAIVAAHADASDSNKAIYSISGVRLSKPQKGLNIIGGKKVVIK